MAKKKSLPPSTTAASSPGSNVPAEAKLHLTVMRLPAGTSLHRIHQDNAALCKLGIHRKELIDTEKDQYPYTRTLATRIHRQQARAQGLLWTSRQDDSAKAVVLFGDRIGPTTLRQIGSSRELSTDPIAYDAVLQLAERIGVDIIPAT